MHPFAPFVATLGRGPGRSRALTRDEAREAFLMVLRGQADPLQIGAFLMLLRYRGEDPEEIAGLVEAAREAEGLGLPPGVDRPALDWPSYGAGRTRGAPWFLLAALALARSGVSVLMHGTNEFSTGMDVEAGLAALGMAPATSRDEAWSQLGRDGFAFVPASLLAPGIARLLGVRDLLGLRSPVNTVARLLDPGDAAASVDGVFHPPYIDVHMGVAERLDRPRLAVVKGGGGEAERNPSKPVAMHLWRRGLGRSEASLMPLLGGPGEAVPQDAARFAAIWRGEAADAQAIATIKATIALGLLAVGDCASPAAADAAATPLWESRHRAGARLRAAAPATVPVEIESLAADP